MFWIILFPMLIIIYCLMCYIISYCILIVIHAFLKHKIHSNIENEYGDYIKCKKCGVWDSFFHINDQTAIFILSPISLPYLLIARLCKKTISVCIAFGPIKISKYIRTQLGLPNDWVVSLYVYNWRYSL